MSAESLIATGRFSEVAGALDEMEMQTDDVNRGGWPIALHILAHVYNFDMEDARFVWKRLTGEEQQTPEARSALLVLQCAWNKDYEGFWRSLRSFRWDQDMTLPLVGALDAKMRLHMVDLLSKAYSDIHVDKLARLLGTSPADALSVADSQGWEQDGAGMIKVHRKTEATEELTDMEHLQKLAEYAIHMETG